MYNKDQSLIILIIVLFLIGALLYFMNSTGKSRPYIYDNEQYGFKFETFKFLDGKYQMLEELDLVKEI